ncbi:hypothetical protein [Hanstruepera ponticola]|uniref:hypothetical protein n=1 Tax=Hanstruepera ponticola TaxID=2042995 RepID=UPI001781C4AB|nr:hypothetical protein [Hanstruepera ponticola]
MNNHLEHIKYAYNSSTNCSFYSYNIFKINHKKIELDDIFNFDLLLIGDYSKLKKHQSERVINEGLFSSKHTYKTKVIDAYGPVIKSTITSNDFKKLSYEMFEKKMNSIIDLMYNRKDLHEADDLYNFFNQSLIDLENFNLENCDFYFLDSNLFSNTRKHKLSFIYSYFISIVGINPDLNTFFILNFGND